MNTPRDTSILAQLGEATELECKPAHNGLPEDLWRTYSALANTYGGVILLGAQVLGFIPLARAGRYRPWQAS